ncbi:hypothetical protein FRC02_010933 [Tulasnella sp. 418]|nr:hypothetical protein FRC02_010933 [Tulasnella sp. 418]
MPPQRNSTKSKTQRVKSKGKLKARSPNPETPEAPSLPLDQTSTSLSVLGFSAAIEVDGQNLTCYTRDVNGSTRTTTCFIESQAGKTYRIRVEREANSALLGVDLIISLHLDGDPNAICNSLMRATDRKAFIGPIPSGPRESRSLVFCPVQTTDAESDIIPSSSCTDVGSIVLRVTKVKVNSKSTFRRNHYRSKMLVHERTKMEGAHSTILGPAGNVATEHPAYTAQTLDEPNNYPFLKLVFRYKPRNILMANGIIPNDQVASQNRDEPLEPEEHYNVSDDSNNQTEDDDVELLELEAQEAEAEAQKAAAHAALLAARAKKAALLRSKSKGIGKSSSSGKVKTEEDVIDLTEL